MFKVISSTLLICSKFFHVFESKASDGLATIIFRDVNVALLIKLLPK